MACSATTLLNHPSFGVGSLGIVPRHSSSTNPRTPRMLQTSFLTIREPKKLVTTTHHNSTQSPSMVESLVDEFDPSVTVEEAVTLPSSWYTDPTIYALELDRVFYRGWQVVGYIEQIKDAHDYFTGSIGNVEYVVCRDGEGELHAFHNVCRHRASLLASGSGKTSCFVCPYHGWTYGLDGALLKATKTTGIKKFNPKDYGLVALKVAIWGPFVVANFDKSQATDDEVDYVNLGHHLLGSCSEMISALALESSFNYVCKREYTVDCNWKVYCDNYIDGAYHIPYAHKYHTSELDFDTVSNELYEKVIIQRCASKPGDDGFDRLGSGGFYAFVYPNFIFERYGPWMCTVMIHPLGQRKCQTTFDFFLDASFKDDKSFIERSLKISDQIQMELCESVQKGLESPMYHSGRYSPSLENGVHHFHCLLHNSLKPQ